MRALGIGLSGPAKILPQNQSVDASPMSVDKPLADSIFRLFPVQREARRTILSLTGRRNHSNQQITFHLPRGVGHL
jgi:hypothetical protein